MLKRILIFAVLGMCLSACKATSDPRGGGLFGGLQGIYGGGYDDRIQQRRVQLDEEQEKNRDLWEKSKTIENEVQLRDRMLVSEQQRMVTLEHDLARLEFSTNQLRTKSNQQKKNVANLILKIEDLRKRLNSQKSSISESDYNGGSAVTPERYRILQQERDHLFEEYRKLFEYFKALSAANS